MSRSNKAASGSDSDRVNRYLSMTLSRGSIGTRRFISHCDRLIALLDGAALVFVQLWILVMLRTGREAQFVIEGALAHGRTEKKNLPVARRHASQPSGAAHRGTCRVWQLWRAEASPPRMQPLWPLRRARSGCSREAAAGRCPRLRPGRGVLQVRP